MPRPTEENCGYPALRRPRSRSVRRRDGASLCAERSHEPTLAGASRFSCLASQAVGQRSANDRCHFYSRAQRSLQMAAAFGSSPEAHSPSGSRPMHTKAGNCGSGREYGALLRNDERGIERYSRARPQLCARRLVEAVAPGSCDVYLHDFSRGASPRTNLHAGPSTRIPTPNPSHCRDVELGKTRQGPRPA